MEEKHSPDLYFISEVHPIPLPLEFTHEACEDYMDILNGMFESVAKKFKETHQFTSPQVIFNPERKSLSLKIGLKERE